MSGSTGQRPALLKRDRELSESPGSAGHSATTGTAIRHEPTFEPAVQRLRDALEQRQGTPFVVRVLEPRNDALGCPDGSAVHLSPRVGLLLRGIRCFEPAASAGFGRVARGFVDPAFATVFSALT